MITKLFIKQCEKAGEIQKQFKFKMGDLFIHTDYLKTKHYIVLDESIVSSSVINTYKKEGAIWLPTQEQLQEILQYYYQCNSKIEGLQWGDSINLFMLKRLYDFAVKNKYIVYDINYLWLAFVMKEKYHKVWNGKDWIEENNHGISTNK